MNATAHTTEEALRQIAVQTGSHCVSVSLSLRPESPFCVFLHGANGDCRHGYGASLDEALEAAIADRIYARAS